MQIIFSPAESATLEGMQKIKTGKGRSLYIERYLLNGFSLVRVVYVCYCYHCSSKSIIHFAKPWRALLNE